MQVRLIGIVGSVPEVRQVGDQIVAQVSLGVRARSGNNLELTWLVVDCWNAEVGSSPLACYWNGLVSASP